MSPGQIPAAYCEICKTIFVIEDRDKFEGYCFCPDCCARASDKGSWEKLSSRYEGAKKISTVYGSFSS